MALILEVKVVVQSGKMQLVVDKSGFLKCYVKAIPEKGKANKEVVEVVAKALGISRQVVDIVSGSTGRKKLLKINTDIKYEDVLSILGSGFQKKIF